jgi:hypothetical protein
MRKREGAVTTANSLTEGTPLLDRTARFAEPVTPSAGTRVFFGIGIAFCVAVLALLVVWRPPFVESFLQRGLTQVEHLLRDFGTPAGIVFVCLISILIGFSVMAIHELGHLIVGVLVGFRRHSMFLGPLQFNARFRLSLNPDRRSWWHGGVTLIPDKPEKLRAGALAMVFAGPAANLLTGCGVLLLPYDKGFFSWLFIVASLLAGVVELFLPIRGPTFVFDGLRIWMLLWDRGRSERWLALMRLLADARDGVSPELMSSALLAKATAVRDDSMDTLMAHLLAFSAAFHQHRDDEAAERLETCLTHSGQVPSVVREALVSECAVFQARRRERPDLAEHWLARIPANTQHRWLRSRAEAAILEAKGDLPGALGKLGEVEVAFLTFPRNPQRETLLRLLERWKSELGRSSRDAK